MTITNDERKQVAARLRKKHSERQGTFEPQSMSIQAMNRLDDLLDCLPKRRDIFLDLADLIEPEERTCQMKKVMKRYDSYSCEYEITWFCSECDHPSYKSTKPNYCHNCGARVKEETDGLSS